MFKNYLASSTILEVQARYHNYLISCYESCCEIFTIDHWLHNKLRQENAQLRHKLLIAQNYLENVKNIEKENEELKKFLALYINSPTELLINAQVMHANVSRSHHQLVINKGLLDGVHENASAVYNNSLVGIVTKSYDRHSVVTLVTDPTSKVAVYCASSHATGILSGTGKQELNIAYLEGHCVPGEQIFTSVQSSLYQPNLKIGVIDCAKLNDVIVKPCYQIYDLRFLQIYR